MKKCLIIVDYQNDFVDGALGFKGAEDLEPIIISKINEALANKNDILFTLDTHYDNYLETQEGKRLPIMHCIFGSKGHEVYGKVNSYLKDAKKVFKKLTFGSLELGNYLEVNKYDEIELCGLVTNMCVVSNAIIAKAANPEARIVVDSKAVKSFSEELHDKTLDVLNGIQVDVL
ncbi:MAG: cysteine hydrolase family protein [Acholeplasma sp.]|nr:cysteine hydrolase family protein [Acholeplasma sp.]